MLDEFYLVVAQVIDNRCPQFKDPLLDIFNEVAPKIIDPVGALLADGLYIASHIFGVILFLHHVGCDLLQLAVHFLPHLLQGLNVGERVVLLVDRNVVPDALGAQQLNAV